MYPIEIHFKLYLLFKIKNVIKNFCIKIFILKTFLYNQ